MPAERYLAHIVARALESRHRRDVDNLEHHLAYIPSQVAPETTPRRDGGGARGSSGARTAAPYLATVRIVLDSNILVRANPKVSPRGLARDLLLTTVSGPHTLVLSQAILVEVQRVLAYPHVQARWPLTEEAIEQSVAYLGSAGILVEPPVVFSPVVSDPDDDRFCKPPL